MRHDSAAIERVSFERTEEPKLACPNCGSEGLSVFYGVQDIPVHSCLLVPTHDEAVDFPTGDLRLGFCRSCGFVTNTHFDPDVHRYSVRYEETQGFSPRFNAFAESLAESLIERYGVRGKTVLEIGCGKGEFLVTLCGLGNNRGIGIDPGYVPERTPGEAASSVTFIQDFYSENYAHLKADFIVCRHTLEHIAPTRQFLQTIRGAIGDRRDTLVFLEVPDMLRVLREGAFWDVYYEHCSYFSPGSLARLFRSTGFDVIQLDLDFDGQYILLTARPSAGGNPEHLPLEDDLEQLSRAVDGFEAACSAVLDRWRLYVAASSLAGGRVVLWGSGSKGVAFLTTLGLLNQVEYVVDINPYRQGKFMPGTGQEIVPPDFLSGYKPDRVIAMNPIYRDEIRRKLDGLGIAPELVAV